MASNKIRRVTIEKLWGVKNISTDFYEDVNIFIGDNGTYKTTFIKLIEAVLLCDAKILYNTFFKRIKIEFSLSEIGPIEVIRTDDNDNPIKYVINSDNYIIPYSEIYQLRRPYYMYENEKEGETIISIKNKLHEIVEISWLSINRDTLSPYDLDRRDFVEKYNNTVDVKLRKLAGELLMYQLQLESDVNIQTKKFKEAVLSLMLYNDEFDKYSYDVIEKFKSINTQSIERDLFKAFNALGVAKDKREQIQNHIQKINAAIDKISSPQGVNMNDAFVLALIKRTLSIIEISKDHQKRTNDIFEPMEKFLIRIQSFMKDKKFSLKKENKGGVDVILKDNGNNTPISLYSLSSGEKQLFILLAEALLHKNRSYLFIADEPELSLHIAWQKRILPELVETNKESQIIVATHSPEIAGGFPKKIVNMKNIISDEYQ